jgi:hypothetical protein
MLDFDSSGNLPAGVHEFTWEKVLRRFGWNQRRRRLLGGLKRALDALKAAGCSRAYIDGSFVTAKEEPGDFDGCWEVNNVDPSKLDPVLLDFRAGRLAQKIKYCGEMFPVSAPEDLSDMKIFLEFFQTDKITGNAKGIVAIDIERLP